MRDYIKIIHLEDGLQGIDERIKTLLMSVETTIPGNRGFGLSYDFLDAPEPVAASQLAAELQEKADIYIPEILIDEATATYDYSGRVQLTLSIRKKVGA